MSSRAQNTRRECVSLHDILSLSLSPSLLSPSPPLSSLSRQSEVEETLKRIQSHRGVVGVVIVNQEGESDAARAIYEVPLMGTN